MISAILIDDIEDNHSLYGHFLGSIDVVLKAFLNNEEGIKAIEETCTFGYPLHVVITDIMRPEGPQGLAFIEYIRNAPFSKVVGGGLRLRYLPIVVRSSWALRYREQVARIDSDIPVLGKNTRMDCFVEAVTELLAIYRAKLLSELHHLGIAVVWKDGKYQVLQAYGARNPRLIETDRFEGTSPSLTSSYTALCLISEGGTIARYHLDQFERLLNSRKTGEADMQRFLELHPEFILGSQFDSYWSQPTLPTADFSRVLRPDFVLQPFGLRTTAWNWQLVDLKSPSVPLMANSRFHRALSHHVTRVVTQLKDYGAYFADPRHEDAIRLRFGGVVPQPKLVALIGRLPDDDSRDRYTALRTRITDVSLTTYDEILEFRRARVEQIEATLSRKGR